VRTPTGAQTQLQAADCGRWPLCRPRLHYTGCGCPVKPQQRNADVVDFLVRRAHLLHEKKLVLPVRKLRVAYVLPHHNVTGGLKCLCEHLRLLRERGHYTVGLLFPLILTTKKYSKPLQTILSPVVAVLQELQTFLAGNYASAVKQIMCIWHWHHEYLLPTRQDQQHYCTCPCAQKNFFVQRAVFSFWKPRVVCAELFTNQSPSMESLDAQ